VDMETAAIFSVAKRFDMKREAILTVTDNLFEEKYLFSEVSEQEKMKRSKARDVMFKIALNYPLSLNYQASGDITSVSKKL